jgi:hypothetical protein
MRKILLVLGIVILVLLIVTGIYFYTQKNKSFTFIISILNSDPAGVKETKEMLAKYPNITKKVFINQQFQGTLTAVSGKSWVITADGQTVTLINNAANTIRYSKLPLNASVSATASAIEIKAEDLKTGDKVTINRSIDWQTGQPTFASIVVVSTK